MRDNEVALPELLICFPGNPHILRYQHMTAPRVIDSDFLRSSYYSAVALNSIQTPFEKYVDPRILS